MDEKLKQLLQDYVATANSGKYKSLDEVNAKFPELNGYDKAILSDYVATVNSGKYASIDEVNSKFPEFSPKSNEVSQIGSEATSGGLVEPTQQVDPQTGLPLQPSANLSGQSLTGGEFVDRSNSLNTALQQATGLEDPNNLFEITLQEGEEFLPNRLTEEGLPIIANMAEGTASNILSPVDITMNRDAAIAQNQRIAQEDLIASTTEDKGIMSDLKNTLLSGLSDFNSQLAMVPEYLYEIGAIPQNLLADAIDNNAGEGTADWLRTRYENVSNGVYNPVRILSDYAKGQKENAGAFSAEVTQFEDDITGSLSNGSFGDAGRQLLNGIVGSAPSILGIAMTSGVGGAAGLGAMGKTALNALPFAAGAYQEIEENPDINQNMKMLTSGLKGLSEVVFEQSFGTNKLIEGIANKALGKEEVKLFVDGYMRRLLDSNGIPASAFKGSLSEASTQLSQNIIDKYSGNKPDIDVFQGVMDAAITGGVMDAGISTGGKISSSLIEPQNRKRAQELEAQNADLRNDLESSENPDVIQEAIERNTAEFNALMDEDFASGLAVPAETRDQVVSINNKVSDIDTALAAEDLSEGTKTALESQKQALEKQAADLVVEGKKIQINRDDVDLFVKNFQENNPNTTVELFDDLPDQVVRTFDRVEAGLPTDPVSLEESSKWLYDKYKQFTQMKSSPDRLHTIEQIEGIQEQLASDIETLENYRYEQTGERSGIELQSETTVDTIPAETEITNQEGEIDENIEVPVEVSTEVVTPSVEATVESTQELVSDPVDVVPEVETQNVVENENVIEPVVVAAEEAGQQNQEVDAEPDQVVPVIDKANPKLKRAVQSIPDQDINSIMGPANVEKRRDVLEAVTGKRPSKNDAGISVVKKELSKFFGIPEAELPVSVKNWANFTRTEFSSPEEAVRYEAENTDNPDDIVRLYEQSETTPGDFKTSQIADYVGSSKINYRDYIRFGDQNNMVGNAKFVNKWIDKGNSSSVSLEQMAAELSDQTGLEVTEQDIIDYIDSNDSLESFRESNKSDTEVLLEQRYKELTGRNLTPKVVNRVNAKRAAAVTNDDLVASDPNMQALGVTPAEVAARSEMEAAAAVPETSAPLPKSLLKGISDRLKLSGLANSVSISNSVDITDDKGINGQAVKGYVDSKGNIVINRDTANIDTPIHEFGHLWEDVISRENPELHARGMALIKGPDGKEYVDFVKSTQPSLTGEAVYKEALAQAIGDSGAKIVNNQRRAKITEWLKAAWDFIAGQRGISGMTATEVSNLSLREFSDAVSIDLLSGKPFARLPNGDVLMETKAKSPSELNVSEEKISSFIEKMRAKNGIKYQGTIPSGELTNEELKEFIDVIAELKKTGKASTFSDLLDFSSSLGIKDIGQIRYAWNANSSPVGIKKGLLDPKTILDTDIEKMTRDEWIALGKRLVDEGLIDADAMVREFVQDSTRTPRAYEITALVYKKSLVEKEIDLLSTKTDPDSLALLDSRLQMLKDFEIITLNTAYQQGMALNLRALITDKDFNVVEIIRDMEKIGDVSAELRSRLEALGKELQKVKSDLRKKTLALEKEKAAGEVSAINGTYKKPAVVSRPNASSVKDALEVLDSINISDFGLVGMNFQANGVLRFSVNPNASVSGAVEDALSSMKENVSQRKLSLSDALELAVDQINETVGKGNWNEMKFRSSIINPYVDKGHAPTVKKPYVGTDGKLVVPSQYLKDIVSDYRNTTSSDMSIEDIVSAVSAEVGSGFDAYEIRNAITGYGRSVQNTLTDEQKNINIAKSVGKLLSELEDLENRGPNPKSRNSRKVNERVMELRKAITDLENSMTSTPEERAQMQQDKAARAKKTYINNYIEKINRKIADKDFAPASRVPKYDFSNDPEIVELEKKREDIRNQFKSAKYEHELKNKTFAGKVAYWGEQVFFGLSRGLSAGTDISSFLIQGGLITFADPKRSVKALVNSVKKAGNSDAYNDYFHELQRDPMFEVARKAKLNMQLPNFYQNIVEEQLGGGNVVTWLYESGVDAVIKDPVLAKKFKDRFPLTAAERQYALFLSDVRFNLFKTAATDAMNYMGADPATKEGQEKLSEIAEAVNDITMASNIKFLEGATKVQKAVNLLMFSARKLAANFKILYKLPMYSSYYLANKVARATGKNALANRTEFEALIFQRLYGRYAAAGLGVMASAVLIPTVIANATYDDDEEPPLLYNPHVLNPIHSDFMKLKIGDTRWSPFLGIEGAVGLIARLSTQTYMTSTSNSVKKMGERSGMSTNKTGGDILSQFFKNKLAPTPAIIAGIYGSEFEQRETSDRLAQSFYPMWISGFFDEYETSDNLSRSLGTTALSLFGANFNTYGGAQFASFEGTKNDEAYNIMRKAGISDYTPDFKNKLVMEDGSLVEELSKSKMKEEYAPKYNEYMTAGVIAKKNIILNSSTTMAAKESQINNLKSEAYRYAELKSTGAIIDANFRSFTHDGVKYALTKNQYSGKLKLINRYMSEFVTPDYKTNVKDIVIQNLDEAGIARNPEYIKKRVDLQIWNDANSWANDELSYNFSNDKYIPTTEYSIDEDDYTND